MVRALPRAARGRRLFGLGTAIFAVLAAAMGHFAYASFRKWEQRRQRVAALEMELATLKSKNAGLAGAHDVLQNRRFQVCNRTADEVTIPWFTAVYQSGHGLRVFDSSRCDSWEPQGVPTGGSPKNFNLSSIQEGCNWDGAVIFYAMRIARTDAEGLSLSFDVAGPWQGFDRACFTIQ